MSIDTNVVEVFDKFAVEISGDVVMFNTKADADIAAVLESKAAEIRVRALAYCTFKGLVAKNAAAKINVITDFLTYEATLPAS